MAGVPLRVSVRGLDQLGQRVTSIASGLPASTAAELYRDMVVVMAESQRIVPYDEGDLHDSGETDRPEISGGRVSIDLHYGSAEVDYALEQHENLDYHHPNGGQAKFLETALHQWSGAGPAQVAARALRAAGAR